MKINMTEFILDINGKETGFRIPVDLGMLGICLDDTKLKPKSDKCQM